MYTYEKQAVSTKNIKKTYIQTWSDTRYSIAIIYFKEERETYINLKEGISEAKAIEIFNDFVSAINKKA